MGENAWFMNPGQRSAHSYIPDTCSECHLIRTDPPAEFSYNLGGTNHSFAASTAICSQCHASVDGDALQAANQASLGALEDRIDAIETALGFDDDDPATFTDNTETLVKARWNALLLEEDLSHGVHNPSFFKDVIAATYKALNDAYPN